MQLGIIDRIQLLNILPEQGGIVTLRIVAELREALGFSESDITTAGIKQDEQGRITWNASAELEKDVTIGDTAKGIIKAALKKLDEEQKLTAGMIPLWDMFCS